VRHDRTTRQHFRRASAALVAALVLAGLQPAAPAAAEATFTFEGGGFGHSVGMSQFGAYGMALDGFTWQEILTHYFTDTTVAEADPQFTDPPLWVGITQEKARVDFLVTPIRSDPAPVTITRADESLTAVAGETITIEHLGDDVCRVTTPSGTLTGGCSMDLEWDGWEPSPTTALQLQGCTLADWNAPGGTVFRPCKYARGTMHIRPDNNTQTVDVALEIDIEDYVLGISESPYGWGSTGGMAALEAQAVAARSYALHRAIDRGDPESRPWCWCQIYDTPVDQNYVGWGHGTQNWIDAVRNTEHMVLTHPSETYNGTLMPIETFYSSSTFGWTENSEHGFTAYVPYLRSVDDHWSLDPRVFNHSARWIRQFGASDLAARLPGLSTVTGLEVTGCSTTGAALEITFTGSGGPRAFTTRQLRGYLGLRSMQIIRAGSPLPGSPACPQPGDGGTPPVEGGPVTLAGLTLDDDSSGDSFGNADGNAQCGETVEVFTNVTNEGEPLTGVSATLTSGDPYVSVRWNTWSTFPDLPEGGSVSNTGDWDLAIAADTPARHDAVLSMRVQADNGGPWDIEVTFPISCRTLEATTSVGIPDLDGNGSPDIATAVRLPSGRQILKARDAQTGETTGKVRLSSAAYEIVDLDPVPGSDTQIAALIVRDDGATRVVIADLATGTRAATIRFGPDRAPVALAVIPDIRAGINGFAVLMDNGNGTSRIFVRKANGKLLAKRGVSLDPIDMERLDNLDATQASEISVLGRRASGKVTTVTLDVRNGTRFAITGYGMAPAVDLETLPGDGSDIIDTVAVLQRGEGESLVTLADAHTGAIIRSMTVPITAAIDLEILPDLDGADGAAVAVFGTAADGVPTAIVADPHQARLLAGPVFAADAAPIDLAVLIGFGPSGVTLASLGATSLFSATLSLRDAVSGAPLGTIRVP
jgi:SpoIID/LytB domain protein